MSGIENDVAAYQKERLRELASRPNTTVLDVQHDHHHDPWTVARLRPLLERLTGRVISTPDDVPDFVLRKQCAELLMEEPRTVFAPFTAACAQTGPS